MDNFEFEQLLQNLGMDLGSDNEPMTPHQCDALCQFLDAPLQDAIRANNSLIAALATSNVPGSADTIVQLAQENDEMLGVLRCQASRGTFRFYFAVMVDTASLSDYWLEAVK